MKKRKGFTLIEILIVVVILAILATLVLPKMLAQPESAALAEANQMLGALARAQDTFMQLTGNSVGLVVSPAGGGAGGEAAVACDVACNRSWTKLGLQPPRGARFKYQCFNTGKCEASRVVAGTSSAIAIDYRTYPKSYTCSGLYSQGTDTTRGCIIV